jgi:hypothetical protein
MVRLVSGDVVEFVLFSGAWFKSHAGNFIFLF